MKALLGAGANGHSEAARRSPAVRLPSLTSLRWFAAAAVFLAHADLVTANTAIGPALDRIGPQGVTGVSFFFMLSGFVLAWTYQPGDTVRDFYRRRIARILPAYLIVTAAALVFVITVLDVHGTVPLLKTIFPATLLQAWVPEPSVYGAGNWVAWSMSAEVFFYALFPLLIGPVMRLDRRRLVWLMGACAVVAILAPLTLQPSAETEFTFWVIYINPLYRLLEFVIGMCICALIRGGLRLRIPPIGAAAIALAAYLAAYEVPLYASRVATTVVPFAVLIFAFAEADLDGRRTGVRHPFLIRLGQWSYAFYLVHSLVLRSAQLVADQHPSTVWRGSLLLGSFVLATLIAYLLFRFVEVPLERRIRHGGTATPPSEVHSGEPALART
jgi:peptidoglycan/LPS O-acetylase OafA/YrhL